MDDADFRTRQVLADLDRVLGLRPISDFWSPAVDPAPELSDLCAATAVLLRDLVETGALDPALEDLWATHRSTLGAAPASVRAALMNGFDHLRHGGQAPEICAPTPEEQITWPLERVESALISIARQMTPEERDHVARADYGCDAARHREALEVLLRGSRMAYPPGEVWFPAEVVELVSHVPGQPGHVPCLAIVLLEALRTGDRHGNASFRFEQQFSEVAGLHPPACAAFFAAFRHLFEAERDWNPSLTGGSLPLDQSTIPWTDLP